MGNVDLFGNPINEKPPTPKGKAVFSLAKAEAPAADYTANGAIMPYEWWRSGDRTTVIWNTPAESCPERPAPPGAAS